MAAKEKRLSYPVPDEVVEKVNNVTTGKHVSSGTRRLGKASDFVSIRTVVNGWIVVLQSDSMGDYSVGTPGDTLVFNNIDDLTETLKEIYKNDLS